MEKPIKIGPYSSSRIEIIDLMKALIAISIAFAIVMRQGFGMNFISTLLVSALTAGIGFLLHELGHKVIAQRYGCFAEFRSFNSMLWLMLLFSLLGFVFAAPGAVMINGPVGIRRNGKISAAGPVVNILLALFFLFAIIFLNPSGFFGQISEFGLRINSWLALFNMIPVWNLDGKKVWAWNKIAYGTIVIVAFLLTFGSSYLSLLLGK